MSYMDAHAAFAHAGGIQELSFNEMNCVNGAGDAFEDISLMLSLA